MFAAVMFFTPGAEQHHAAVVRAGRTASARPCRTIAGITFGFAFMIGVVGLGLGTIFITYPVLQTILKYAGVAYLIYLAAAIAMSGPVKPDHDKPAAGR